MRQNILKLLILTLFSTSLSSCLKDDKYALDPSLGHNVVEFLNVTGPVSAYNDKYVVYIPKTFENIADGEFEAGVNWAGPENLAPQDIVLKLEANATAATEVGFVQLPSNLYEFPSEVTIKKGEKSARFTIKVKPSSFNGDTDAIGLSISSSSYGTISGNIGTVIYRLPVKNIYDGVYRYQSTAAQTLGPNRDLEVELRTLNSNTVRIGSGLIGLYPGNTVDYTVNRTTNAVTVGMTTLLPIATNPISRYDPATKTFHLTWTSNGGARIFYETLTYLRPR